MLNPPKRLMDWEKLIVRSKVQLKNSLGSLPAASLFTVTGVSRGLSVQSFDCDCCGLSLGLRKAPIEAFEILDTPQPTERSLLGIKLDTIRRVDMADSLSVQNL